MNDDRSLDLTAVAADDDALEMVRAGRLLSDDRALALLRDLLLDVEAEPLDPVPVGRGSTVLALASEQTPERRLVRGGAVVAALTAGLVSLGGVAAASSLAPPDSPLHGFGEAVRSAAGAVVGAVTPPETDAVPGRSTAAVTLPSPAASAAAKAISKPAPVVRSTPGAAVSATVRSQAAAEQVVRLLDAAEQLLADGRRTPAVERLDAAERRLAEVLPAHGAAALQARLADLRDRAAVAAEPPRTGPRTEPPARDKPRKQEAPAVKAPTAKAERAPGVTRQVPDKPAVQAPQLSKDASTKPRA